MLRLIALLVFQLSGVGFVPAHVESVTAPIPPLNTIEGRAVLASVAVDTTGKVGSVSILEGANPFNDATTVAARQWRFRPAKRANREVPSMVGLLAVYRPPAIGSFAVGGPSLGYKEPVTSQANHPPLPLSITDPGYPPQATTMGVVILELTINTDGLPVNTRTILDVPLLTDVSREAVQSWKFLPAVESGQPVEGSMIVAISFLRPVLSRPN